MTVRAILFDKETAEAVARRLVADGFEAVVERELFQGEDDDQDHPWGVVTDAPSALVEVVIDQYDGWLDQREAEVAPSPLALPDAPRRFQGQVTE